MILPVMILPRGFFANRSQTPRFASTRTALRRNSSGRSSRRSLRSEKSENPPRLSGAIVVRSGGENRRRRAGRPHGSPSPNGSTGHSRPSPNGVLTVAAPADAFPATATEAGVGEKLRRKAILVRHENGPGRPSSNGGYRRSPSPSGRSGKIVPAQFSGFFPSVVTKESGIIHPPTQPARRPPTRVPPP